MTAARTAKRGSRHSPLVITCMQAIDSVPHVDEAGVERREAEAQDVGRTEVADHAPCDQCLHDRVAIFAMRDRHLAPALAGLARRDDRETVVGAALVDELA